MKLLYKFGPFSIDTQNQLLLKEDKPVPLKPKVFDTLLVLVQGKGNVLTKDTLMEKVWAETVVEENNLQQNISTLRKVLGETQDGTPYIETLPRRGYRFAATVEEIDEDEALIVERRTRSKITIEQQPKAIADATVVTASPQESLAAAQSPAALQAAPATQKPWQTRRSVLIAGAVITLMLAAVVSWRSNPKLFNTPKNNRNFTLKQNQIVGIKNDGENTAVTTGKFSPDASMIAFSLETRNRYENIWVKTIDNHYSLQLTKEEGENWNPIWSAKGHEIAFLSNRGNQLGLWKVHHVGGPATLVKYLTPYTPIGTQTKPRLQLWSEDGKTIYYHWDSNVFALDLDSKEATQLTNFAPDKSVIRDFSLSLDQEWIAYVERKNEQYDIWKIPTKGGAPVQVTNDPAIEKTPVWSSDGKSLIYMSSQEGVNELRLFDFDSHESVSLPSVNEAGDIADISRDGSKILYRGNKDESDLWKVNLASGEDIQITSDIGVEFWPDFSPDGETIAFQAMRGSNFQIAPEKCLLLTKALSRESQSVQISLSAGQAQWSPDGNHLAFLREEKNLPDIYIVKSTGGEEKRLTEGGIGLGGFTLVPYNPSYTKNYSWSPDSSKIAYISKKEGLQNVWITSVDGSGETKLSNNTDAALFLASPLWSLDGKRIAYVSDDFQNPENTDRTYKVWIASLENPEKPQVIFQTDSHLKLMGWSGDDELIISLLDKKEKIKVDTFDVDIYIHAGSNSQKLTTLKQTYFSNLRLSPDKKSIAFVARPDEKSNIYTYSLKGGETKKLTKNTDSTIHFSSLAWSSDGKFISYGRQERLNSLIIIEGLK